MSGFIVGQVGQKTTGCSCCCLVSTHRLSLSSYVYALAPFVGLHFALTNPQLPQNNVGITGFALALSIRG